MPQEPRLPELDVGQMSDAQKTIYDRIKNVRGNVRGPFAIWIHNPAIAEHALGLQSNMQTNLTLDRRLLELSILVAARRTSAQFAWFAHERHALHFGIAPELVAAIKSRKTPDFDHDDERLVYDATNELIDSFTLSDATFTRGNELLGAVGMVELVSSVGFYMMVAVTLNAFRAPVPGGISPLE